jgi:Papain family cysteine protease
MSVTIIRDLRGTFGGVRDQGPRPTCLAFAISDAHAELSQPFRPLSVEYLYYHAVQRTLGRDPEKGVSAKAAARALLHDGQPVESEWPYQIAPPANLSLWIPPASCHVLRRALSLDRQSFDQVCQLLNAGHPVVLGLRMSESFYTPNREGIVEQITHDPDTGRHAVVAVGHGRTAKESCILVRNSWGPIWGVEGHAFVEKGYLEKRLILTSVVV